MATDENFFDNVIPSLTEENFRLQLNYERYQEKHSYSEAFPNDYTLALLSNRVYYDEGPKSIPAELEDWEVLTKASNGSITNGYRGVAYFNPKMCHVVIAHRGTDLKKFKNSAVADFQIAIKSFKHYQAQSAASFAYLVAQEIKRVNTENNYEKPPFRLTITGHSLGAWLAQYTTFTVKYLTLNEDKTKFIRDDNYQSNIHPHAVVFESPGCKQIFEDLVSKLVGRYSNRKCGNYKTLDITVYLNEPNAINCKDGHVGTIYMLPIDSHSISDAIDYLASGKINKEVVLDLKYGIKSSLQQVFRCSLKILNFFNMVVESKVQRELMKVPAEEDTCSLNVFTETEREFVIDWYRVNKIQVLYNSTEVTKFRDMHQIPKLEVCPEYNLLKGKEEDINKVIRIAKNLPPSEQLVLKLLNYKEARTYFVEWYEAKLDFNGYFFNDKYDLLNFLKSDKKILHVQADSDPSIGYNFEINYIGNVITYYQKVEVVSTFDLSKESIAFIDWNKLRTFINNSWNFPNNYSLLIVEYCVEDENQNKKVLEFLLNNSIQKVIILSTTNISFKDPKHIKEVNGFGSKLTFGDLNVESQEKFLNKEVFQINNHPKSLNDLFNITSGNDNLMSSFRNVSVLGLILSERIVLNCHYGNLLKSVLFYDLYHEIQPNQLLYNLSTSMVFILREDDTNVDFSKAFSNSNHPVDIGSTEEYEQKCLYNTDQAKYLFTTKNGKIFLTSIFNNNFYMHRSIIHKRSLNPGIFENLDNDLDRFIFYGNKEIYDKRYAGLADKYGNRFIFTVSVDNAKETAKLSSSNIHVFKINEDGAIDWQESNGRINSLQKYMVTGGTLIKEYDIMNNDQIIIISGEPGIGKSSIIEYLYLTLQSKYWIFPIQLKNCSFDEMSEDVTYDTVAKFIIKNCSYEVKSVQDILSFCLQYETKLPIFLMLDSFDAICHEGEENIKIKRKFIINIINFLKDRSTVKILITTRPHLSIELENGISIFSSSFKQLDGHTKVIKFLYDFWKSHLSLFEKDIDEHHLKSIGKNMLKSAENTIGETIGAFIENPMNMRLLAETVTPDTYKTSQFSDVLMLYNKYINQRCDIYFKRFLLDSHPTVKKWLIESILGKISALSIKQLLNVDIQHNSVEEMKEFYKVGLIYSDSNYLTYKFLHDSVCDYFISDAIKQWLTSQMYIQFVEYDLGNVLISKLFLNEALKKVRLFLNFHLKIISITPNRIQLCKNKLGKIYKDNPNLLFNDEMESIFHICIKENLIYMLQSFLLELIDSTYAKDVLMKSNKKLETPLYYAIITASDHDNPKYAINCLSIFLNFLNDLAATDADIKDIFTTTLFHCFVTNEDIDKLKSYTENFKMLQTTMNDIKKKIPLMEEYLNACKGNDSQALEKIWAKLDNDDLIKTYILKSTTKKEKETGIHLTSDINIAKTLIRPYNINLRDYHGMTPLCCSIKNKRNEIAKMLIKNGASYDGDNFGVTPLIHAIKNNLPEVVKMILEPSEENIVDVNARNHFGMTALMMAARQGNEEIVTYLIDREADISLRDSQGVTTFQFAVIGRNVGVVEILKKHRSFECSNILNTPDRHGTTPLLCSVKHKNYPMISKLLSYGADVNIGNNRGEYPLQNLIKEKLKNQRNKEVDKYIKMLVSDELTTPADTTMLSEKEIICMQDVLNIILI